jgi:hypothetical protein
MILHALLAVIMHGGTRRDSIIAPFYLCSYTILLRGRSVLKQLPEVHVSSSILPSLAAHP